MSSKHTHQRPRRQILVVLLAWLRALDIIFQPPELTMSPHIVGCGAGTLGVGEGSCGEGAAREVVANNDAKANGTRIMAQTTKITGLRHRRKMKERI